MKKRIIVTILLSICMFSSITANAAIPLYGEEYNSQPTKTYIQTFSDVPKNYWAFQYISEMVERGILSGYPNGRFYPNNTITRAEFSKIMCLAANLNITNNDENYYADVSNADWFSPYVNAGKYYLSGYISDGYRYFKPNDNALREDIAVALVKLKGYDTSLYDESILKTMFSDYQSISIGARKYISVAVENGLISGYSDDTFRGQNTITRAEAATLLWRAYQYGSENKVFDNEELDIKTKNNNEHSNEKNYYYEPIVTEAISDSDIEEVIEEEVIEPEYDYEVITICNTPGYISNIIATNDGIYFISDYGKKITFVSSDGEKETVLDSDEIEQISDIELSKAGKANLYHIIYGLGVNPSNDHAYTIIYERSLQELATYYLYDLSKAKVVKELNEKEKDQIGVGHSATEFKIGTDTRFYFDEFENLFVPHDGFLYLYDYDNFEFVKCTPEQGHNWDGYIDYYIKNIDEVFNANINYCYALDKEFNFYRIAPNGDETLLFGEKDIKLSDRKKLDKWDFTGRGEGIIPSHSHTTAISNNEDFYFYDYNYDCIRKISKI